MRLVAIFFIFARFARPLGLAPLVAFSHVNAVAQSPAPPSPHTATPYFAAEAVRAAYLVNFIRFTRWPEPLDQGPLIVGVSGSRALEDELIRLADRQLVGSRALRIIRIKNLRDLPACHVVYFASVGDPGEEAPPPLASALTALRGQPVLTVSEDANFLALGGIIQLYREDEKLRFAIAPNAARDSRLVLSSRLLKLARIVREPTPIPAP